jgi:hypothetical protein
VTDLTLTLAELLGVVLFTTTLAVTDGAALSKLLLAALGKRIGVEPATVTAYDDATDDDQDDAAGDP